MSNKRETKCILLLLCALLLSQASCSRTESTPPPSILLFNGVGTSPNDVEAIGNVLKARGHKYATADSNQLNGMSDDQIRIYHLIILPGGNYITMGNSLTPETTQRLQNAVRNGVNYLGICAGGLLAGKAECNSLNLSSGVKFDFYGLVNRSIHKDVVSIDSQNTPRIDHYWENGPQFTGWGKVVGKYPDGAPAIVEDYFGKGFVVLCGVHPEAPDSWKRNMTFSTKTSAANDYAGSLVESALNGKWIPHFE